MWEKEYWKKKWVPAACVTCGNKPKVIPTKATLMELFSAVYSDYSVVLDKHPLWKVPCWYGKCGKCLISNMLSSSNALLIAIGTKKKTQKGNTSLYDLLGE